MGSLWMGNYHTKAQENQSRINKVLSLSDKNTRSEAEFEELGNKSKELHQIKLRDEEKTPLWWRKRIITPSYGNLLGFSQAETIMKEYNNLTNPSNFQAAQIIKPNETINIPLIYPELKDYFPHKRTKLTENTTFEKYKNIKADHLLVVSQCENGKTALAYYKNGILNLATYISAGTQAHRTISGYYQLKHDNIFRRSRKYQNSAMPYSIWITWGYFLHQGKSDGTPKSHGCIRVPGLYQKWLYEQLLKAVATEEVPMIILEWLYTPTLLKQTKQ